ncbi:MAG: hypothetical protein JSV81_17760 [Anaerolineales bacterium]|nr:MAG: hypothetical protein JSV81_17760 [Anaerolineales bacterium]
MRIGKIVKSNTHVDYVCQIYGPGEVADPAPSPEDYAFGTFVRVELSAGLSSYLVGLIYSTILMNPEFGNLGPRLSPPADLEVFSPDYLREQATLVGIVAVGQVVPGGTHQGVPRLAAAVGAEAVTMSADEVRDFHASQPGDGLALAYAPLLLAQGDPLIPHLLLTVVNRLGDLFPDHARQLAVLRGNLAWKTAVTPAG